MLIRLFPLRGGTPDGGWDEKSLELDTNLHTLVEVITDEGVTGVGSAYTSAKLVEGAIDVLRPHLIGASALDPAATTAVEELLWELRGEYTILIVTHNMAQARRASEECIYMLMGKVVEHAPTDVMFVTPKHKETADYIEGRYG